MVPDKLTKTEEMWFGNSAEIMAKLDVEKADIPRASTILTSKDMAMKVNPPGPWSRNLWTAIGQWRNKTLSKAPQKASTKKIFTCCKPLS